MIFKKKKISMDIRTFVRPFKFKISDLCVIKIKVIRYFG